jgi:hypothetical protein
VFTQNYVIYEGKNTIFVVVVQMLGHCLLGFQGDRLGSAGALGGELTIAGAASAASTLWSKAFCWLEHMTSSPFHKYSRIYAPILWPLFFLAAAL